MKNIIIFSSKTYEKPFFERINQNYNYNLVFVDFSLNINTVSFIKDYPQAIVCCFVNDKIDAQVLDKFSEYGVKLLALRSAGFNHVDITHAKELNIPVVRVPKYSPYAVAEHTLGLILMLNRKLHRAYNRVREHDFSLNGLMGFDIHQSTIGIIGTGNIGTAFANIMSGFGCRLLAYDPIENDACKKLGVEYVPLENLYHKADIISLHCPLNQYTQHIINDDTIAMMKNGVMLINTSRGALVDTKAVIKGLKSGKIGYLGLDVYEEEENLFFTDLSDQIIQDDTFARLQTFPNVVITGHQAFFTSQAMENIIGVTLENIHAFLTEKGKYYLVE